MAASRGKLFLPFVQHLAVAAAGSLEAGVRRIGFWVAIVLPLVYLPLLLASFPWVIDFGNFARLLTVHLVAIAVGGGHVDPE